MWKMKYLNFFVKSSDNDSNILTENLRAEFHENHIKKMVGEKVEDVSRFGNI